jgi:hypothetical protein
MHDNAHPGAGRTTSPARLGSKYKLFRGTSNTLHKSPRRPNTLGCGGAFLERCFHFMPNREVLTCGNLRLSGSLKTTNGPAIKPSQYQFAERCSY